MQTFIMIYTQVGIFIGIVLALTGWLRPIVEVDQGGKYYFLNLVFASFVTTVLFVLMWPLFVANLLFKK